jgi:hypothetical protein
VDDILSDSGGEDGEGEDGGMKYEYVMSQYAAYGTRLRLYEFSLTCCMRDCPPPIFLLLAGGTGTGKGRKTRAFLTIRRAAAE